MNISEKRKRIYEMLIALENKKCMKPDVMQEIDDYAKEIVDLNYSQFQYYQPCLHCKKRTLQNDIDKGMRCQECGMSNPYFTRDFLDLVDSGWISIEYNNNLKGDGNLNVYQKQMK